MLSTLKDAIDAVEIAEVLFRDERTAKLRQAAAILRRADPHDLANVVRISDVIRENGEPDSAARAILQSIVGADNV